MTETLPDRLSVNPASPHYDEELLKKVYDSAEYQEFMAKRGFDVTWRSSTDASSKRSRGLQRRPAAKRIHGHKAI